MKILCVSDREETFLYERLDASRFSGIDLVLSCGDLPPEYLTSLATAFKVPLYYVKGNHDIRYAGKPPQGCTDIHGKLVQYQGIRFLGLEGSRWYNGGPNQYTDLQMKKMIRSLKTRIWWQGGIDIMISHAPPRHVHDAEDRCHRGFNSFHQVIDRYAPQYLIHGHIHAIFNNPSERTTIVKQTKVVNSYGHFLLQVDFQPQARQGWLHPQGVFSKRRRQELP